VGFWIGALATAIAAQPDPETAIATTTNATDASLELVIAQITNASI
jgi:hypothetical protein